MSLEIGDRECADFCSAVEGFVAEHLS